MVISYNCEIDNLTLDFHSIPNDRLINFIMMEVVNLLGKPQIDIGFFWKYIEEKRELLKKEALN